MVNANKGWKGQAFNCGLVGILTENKAKSSSGINNTETSCRKHNKRIVIM